MTKVKRITLSIGNKLADFICLKVIVFENFVRISLYWKKLRWKSYAVLRDRLHIYYYNYLSSKMQTSTITWISIVGSNNSRYKNLNKEKSDL